MITHEYGIIMHIFNTLSELRQWRKQLQLQGKTLALVPTMGNLHQGHLQLVETAKQQADYVITSIFVNPLQFAAHEDLDAYPRTFEQDCKQLNQLGNHAVFYPSVKEMYPNGMEQQTIVEVPEDQYSLIAEAQHRPGHFKGVSTVVTKLFNMVQPDSAIFGKKDYQQLRVIHRLVEDLNLPIKIIGVDTIREDSGLAKSSRNNYLTAEEKATAPALNAIMLECKQQIVDLTILSESHLAALEDLAEQKINAAGFKTDYFVIREANTLAPIQSSTNLKAGAIEVVILAAAHLGKARLLDNLTFVHNG